MIELFRDTACGQIVRFVSRGNLLSYPEEKNPELWKNYVHEEKSANFAKYGQVERPSSDDGPDNNEKDDDHASGKNADSEKGKDKTVITFLENDPEVCFVRPLNLKSTLITVHRILATGRDRRNSL
jgi:DHA1 family multidrug resistance protein-like MFS transporter